MISLRYHIVSLVAVFLALALGIVVGSTVLKEGSVALLRATSNKVRAESEAARADNARLRAQLGNYQDFTASVLPQLVHDRLRTRSVVLVDTDRVDDATRDKVTKAVEAAGGTVDGRITFATDRLTLAGAGDRDALRRLLPAAQGDPADPAALRAALIGLLVDRLAVPNRLPQDDRSRPADVLTGLQDARFLADLPLQRPFADGRTPFPRPGSLFVLIGPTDPTTLPSGAFLVPLADRLATRTAAVVGVEKADGTTSWVADLRNARGVANRVSTVDDVDQVYGQVALVEALQRRVDGQGTGQYGTKPGASALLPEKPGGS